MSDIQLYLFEEDSAVANARAIAQQTAAKLVDKEIKLLELIESLGEYFNHENAKIRIKTTAYLAEVLGALPPQQLTRQQRDLLCDFILAKISNGAESLGYCANALLSLAKMAGLDSKRVAEIVTTLLTHTSPLIEFKQQIERMEVLNLVDFLLSNYREVLQDMHRRDKQFLTRFVEYVDGEKDPRNLMIVFSVLNVPMVEWDISQHEQELFNSVFNYFPITFRPPPDDPYGITAQDLKERLKECISSTASFAPYAYPELLDKLDSTTINVKRDALQAIHACVSRYGPVSADVYSITLWDALKYEILNEQEPDLAEAALTSLREISFQLSGSAHDEPLRKYLGTISKECNEHLEETPTKQSSASCRILSSVSRASPDSCNLLVEATVPHILALLKTSDSIARRRGLLEVLKSLVEGAESLFGRWRRIVPSSIDTGTGIAPSSLRSGVMALTEYNMPVYTVFSNNLTRTPLDEVSFRVLALQGLRVSATLRQFLSDAEITEAIRTFVDIIITEEPHGRDEVKAAAIDALVEVAHEKPQLLIETAFPEFMARLPDNDADSPHFYVPVLEALAKLSTEQQIFKTITIRLKNKFYAAIRQKASCQYVVAILTALLYTLVNGAVDLRDPATFGEFYQDIVQPFLRDAFDTSGQFRETEALKDETVLEVMARICNVILRPQSWVAQTEVCRNVYTLFREIPIESVVPFDPLGPSPQTLVISTQLVAALQREAQPHTEIDRLLEVLISFIQSESASPLIQRSGFGQISLVINKYTQSGSPLQTKYMNSLLDSKRVDATSLQIAFAMLKGCVFQGSTALPQLLQDYFFPMLQNDDHGQMSARLFSSLLAPDDLLVKENHCRISALHKQRIFSLVVPKFTQDFQSLDASAGARSNILIALSGVLYWIPYELLKEQLSGLIPLLLQSLRLDETDVKGRTITVLERIINEDPKLVEEHVGGLINRFLDIAVAASAGAQQGDFESSPPKVRAGALACLSAFIISFRVELLLPHKSLVTRRLMFALDDARRAVRAEAVRCRRSWMGLGGGEGDE